MGGGPTSASYVVPPRPKPGRKPATDEPASKRKAQNRESQRAFRARKAAKLTEMQTQVEDAEQRHRQALNEKMIELNDKELRINQLESLVAQLKESEKRTAQERDFWKGRAIEHEEMVKQMKERNSPTGWGDKHTAFFQPRMPNSRQDSPTRESLSAFTPLANTPQAYDTPKTMDIGCGNCKAGGPCACMEEMAKLSNTAFMAAVPLTQLPTRTSTSPMKGIKVQSTAAESAIFAEREIDFTAQFANKRTRLDTRPSIAFLTQTSEADSKCGFCTDDSNCLCRDASLQSVQRAGDDMAPPSRDWNGATPNEVTPSSNDCSTTGPGTCPDCMKDPKQKAWCQRVAQLKSSSTSDYFSGSPTSRNSSISSGLDPIEPHTNYAPVSDMGLSSRYSIGCSEAYKLFDGRVPTDQDNMDWSTLKPISPSARQDTLPSLHAPRKYSALELDTAGVIATLQQSMGPLHPRKEDGAHADLVRIAQEHQRSSNSPR